MKNKSTPARRRKARLALYHEQGGLCLYCKRLMKIARSGEVDCGDSVASLEHVRPRMLGGSSRRENLAAVCQGCNMELGRRLDRLARKLGVVTRGMLRRSR